MLEVHQTPSKLARAYVETIVKSIKLSKTRPKYKQSNKTNPKTTQRTFFPSREGGQNPLSPSKYSTRFLSQGRDKARIYSLESINSGKRNPITQSC
jgi:hypothetical protein